MTTKKQRREQVAEKRARYDEETRRMGLEAQKRDREKREQRKYDANRAESSKKAALVMRKKMEKETKPVGDELLEAYASELGIA